MISKFFRFIFLTAAVLSVLAGIYMIVTAFIHGSQDPYYEKSMRVGSGIISLFFGAIFYFLRFFISPKKKP